ncbi:MAG: Ig-like domain-containing protein [Bacteroidota bacterium]
MFIQLAKRILSIVFLSLALTAFWQCARRGTPSGGPKDVDPPVLLRTEPKNLSINFDSNKIRLYFDEYIKLQDVQNQLIVSPPLKNIPEIKPLGGPSKFIEITLKDTLKENTTYTINFGQSIVDNNEGNPNSFLTYVFSTGDYIDSLSLSGVVKDAYNRSPDEFVSVMLYEIDSIYNDSTIYKFPPNYLANTGDSLPFFQLNNLKAGKYKLFGVKDEGKNYVFDQRADKIAFLQDTITLPTDTLLLLNLFKEIPDYAASVPSYIAKNRIIFGYSGNGDSIKIKSLTQLPDSVTTIIKKERDKDTLNYWITPTDIDSIVFTVGNEPFKIIDTFTVKTRKLALDSLKLTPTPSSKINYGELFQMASNTPLVQVDSSLIEIMDKDSALVAFTTRLDTIENKMEMDFELSEEQGYNITFLPGAFRDFFGTQNDTIGVRLSTPKLSDLGNMNLTVSGDVRYPILVQLTNEKGEVQREQISFDPNPLSFKYLNPGKYGIRVVFDENKNGIWDTGSYLKKIQPERISYFPDIIDVRANWELEQTFVISN